jgi:hypothetical protein
MASKMASHGARIDAHEGRRFRLDENIRGVLIVAIGSAGLIGLAWGVMTVLTSPDGWVTKAANSAIAGEETQLVSFSEEAGE